MTKKIKFPFSADSRFKAQFDPQANILWFENLDPGGDWMLAVRLVEQGRAVLPVWLRVVDQGSFSMPPKVELKPDTQLYVYFKAGAADRDTGERKVIEGWSTGVQIRMVGIRLKAVQWSSKRLPGQKLYEVGSLNPIEVPGRRIITDIIYSITEFAEDPQPSWPIPSDVWTYGGTLSGDGAIEDEVEETRGPRGPYVRTKADLPGIAVNGTQLVVLDENTLYSYDAGTAEGRGRWIQVDPPPTSLPDLVKKTKLLEKRLKESMGAPLAAKAISAIREKVEERFILLQFPSEAVREMEWYQWVIKGVEEELKGVEVKVEEPQGEVVQQKKSRRFDWD